MPRTGPNGPSGFGLGARESLLHPGAYAFKSALQVREQPGTFGGGGVPLLPSGEVLLRGGLAAAQVRELFLAVCHCRGPFR